jgi:NAD+-dependent protein deacetylase SIR2
MKKYFSSKEKMKPRVLGIAFGIAPDLTDDDGLHSRIVSKAILRVYCKRQKLPQYNTIDDAAQLLQQSQSIMVITGAGISTSLGIPDFRSKGTGFYDKLAGMGFSEPEEVFDIRQFDQRPELFYSLAGDILPKGKRFTPTHAFLRLLQDNGKLQTNYTQNIDNLEELAGVERSRLIQCHGSFATATCRKCKYQVPGEDIFDDLRAKRVAQCKRCLDELAKAPPAVKKRIKKSKKHDWDDSDSDEDDDIPQPGVMKPDITFFGELLPKDFFDRFVDRDAKNVDLVIVIGTSLKVAPVSEMPHHLPQKVPHIYISREPIEHIDFDIQLIGDCDHAVYELCRRAGWNLQHEMIPERFRVKVKPYKEGKDWIWRVKPKVPKAFSSPAPSISDSGSVRSSSTMRAA